jgi:hypothetical protein
VQLPLGRGSGGATGLQDLRDGTPCTLLVAPVDPERKIPWTKPGDIAVGPDFPGFGRPGGIAAPYRALSGPAGHRAAPVLFADGSVRAVIDTIHPNVLATLLTRVGNDAIRLDAVPSDPDPSRVPVFVTLRIRRDGDRGQATIDPAEVDRARPTAPAQPVSGIGVPADGCHLATGSRPRGSTTTTGRGVVSAQGPGGHGAHAVLIGTGGSYQPPGDRIGGQAGRSAGDEAGRRAPKSTRAGRGDRPCVVRIGRWAIRLARVRSRYAA